MRLSKISAALTALCLAVGVAAFIGAPAQAATTPKVVLKMARTSGTYGDSISLAGAVAYHGSAVYTGTGYLQRQAKGSTTWANVQSASAGGYMTFPAAKFIGNANYRIYYTGGTNYSGTYAAAFSPVVKVKTYRDLNDSGTCVRGCHLKGHVKPKYKHKRVIVQVKKGKWKTYKLVKTNKYSRFNVKVTASRGAGTKYRIVIKGDKKFARTTSNVYRAYRY
jgi:hypothetical protein